MLEELAQLLNSSPEQAENFYHVVKETVGAEVSLEQVVAEVKALSAESKLVTVSRVAARMGTVLPPVPSAAQREREKREREAARAERQQAQARTRRGEGGPARKAGAAARRGKKQDTLQRIGEILEANYQRATQEGYNVTRWGAEEFVREVRRGVSLKVGKEANILKVMEKLHRQDYLLAPSLVADQVRKEFDPTL